MHVRVIKVSSYGATGRMGQETVLLAKADSHDRVEHTLRRRIRNATRMPLDDSGHLVVTVTPRL